MAGADYRRCDVCDRKAFYDANLNYEWEGDGTPFRVAGKPAEPTDMRLDYVGDWAVICTDCVKTHRTCVIPLDVVPRGEETRLLAAHRADSMLIAAAPDMLEALIKVRDRGVWVSEFDGAAQHAVTREIEAEVRAAITKAVGEPVAPG